MFHYTTASTAVKILDSAAIWAKDVRAMSDKRELRHGAEVFQEALNAKLRTADSVRARMLEQVRRNRFPFDEGEPFEAFIVSLTPDSGTERMWCEHGDLGRGAALRFEGRRLELLRPERQKAWAIGPWPVVYGEQKQSQAIRAVMDSVGDRVEARAAASRGREAGMADRGAWALRTFLGRKQFLFKDPCLAWEDEHRLAVVRVQDNEWETRDVRVAEAACATFRYAYPENTAKEGRPRFP